MLGRLGFSSVYVSHLQGSGNLKARRKTCSTVIVFRTQCCGTVKTAFRYCEYHVILFATRCVIQWARPLP